MKISQTLALSIAMMPLLAPAAELKQDTLKAFEDYTAFAEAEMDQHIAGRSKFLALDESTASTARVRQGETVIEHRGERSMVKIPGGLIHDWMGAIFVPGATLDETLAFVQNYDEHEDFYGPEVIRSRLINRDGNEFRIYYRLLKKKVITIVLDTEHEVKYERIDDHRVRSTSYTTRISEVKDAGEQDETLLPDGQSSGYLWRLNSYWKFEERDGGVYVELRAISLTRGIPTGTGWIVKPIVREMPRVSIEGTLNNTREGLEQRRASAAAPRGQLD